MFLCSWRNLPKKQRAGCTGKQNNSVAASEKKGEGEEEENVVKEKPQTPSKNNKLEELW